ncbi:uncharacterized protein [Miscanthus floridulus]|uniref:uncharacterized protein n=1 Tax=Miscanthus floridulus TaxID=154761 RepID=UPI0034585B54
MPEARVSEERAVSPMGPTVEVEQATVGPTPSSPRRVEKVPGSGGGQLAPVDTEAAPLPPPALLQRRLAVSKRLHPRSRQKHLVGDPALAPRKALKVNVSSSTHQAAEAQAGVQRGAASGGAVSEEAATQGKGAEAAAERVEEEEPTPCDVMSLGAKEAGASTIAEAIEDLEKEASQAAEASIAVQAALDVEVREHKALRSAVCTACEALDVEGVQLASSLGSRLIALSGRVHERLQGALHTGIKHALAVVSSHYAINLEAVSDGYVLPEDDEEANVEVVKLLEAAEAPSAALAGLFEEEVVPPASAADP